MSVPPIEADGCRCRKPGVAVVVVGLLVLVVSGTVAANAAPSWLRYVAVLAALLGTVVLHNRRRLLAVLRTLPRDLRYLCFQYRAARVMRRFRDANASVVSVLGERARTTPHNTCFMFEGKKWTYLDVELYSNRVACAFQRAGLARGDVVALLMANRVEHVCAWLGLAKLGAVTALVNVNLRGAALARVVNEARARAMLLGPEFAEAVAEVKDDLKTVEMFYHLHDESRTPDDGALDCAAPDWSADLAPLLAAESSDAPVVAHTIRPDDHVLYIGTSGTTGLPKAAIVTHTRVLLWPLGALLVAKMTERDAMYCTLPMYHAAAGAYAASLALCHGVPVIYARKFSASRFWRDCVEYNATCVQYIGELCRFLVATPETPYERRHGVRAFIGNGMSLPVWRGLRRRFDVPQVVEFYASTEGNVMFVNLDGKAGTVGFVPRLLPRAASPIDIVRVDEEGEPVRDAVSGLCIRCQEGEVGMVIGRIDDKVAMRQFVGYLDRDATEKKILRDAFATGDRHYLSGDLVVMDELGYIYFKDRTGDTFRWKGENVSTAEVEAVLTSVLLPLGAREVAVFGVQVPGYEGRAGMAAIAHPEARKEEHVRALLSALAERLSGTALPAYARPLFVRVGPALPMTGTHKVSKVALQRQGLLAADDVVYLLDAKKAAFVPLTKEVLADIEANRVRL